MESFYITFRENGNKMIYQAGNRIRGLPEAEYLPLIFSPHFLILPLNWLEVNTIHRVLGVGSKENLENGEWTTLYLSAGCSLKVFLSLREAFFQGTDQG